MEQQPEDWIAYAEMTGRVSYNGLAMLNQVLQSKKAGVVRRRSHNQRASISVLSVFFSTSTCSTGCSGS